METLDGNSEPPVIDPAGPRQMASDDPTATNNMNTETEDSRDTPTDILFFYFRNRKNKPSTSLFIYRNKKKNQAQAYLTRPKLRMPQGV